MSFRKLGRKLSAVLCSAMMFGGSNISNHPAMAIGGLELKHKLHSIKMFGETNVKSGEAFTFNNMFLKIADEENFDNSTTVWKSFKLTFPKEGEKHSDQIVSLYFGQWADGKFAISVKDGSTEARFGILPFSYFVYHLKKAGLACNEVKAFNEMDKDAKKKLLIAILGILDFNAPDTDYESLLASFCNSLELVQPDHSEENEDFKISNICTSAFKKAKPMVGDQLLFGDDGKEIAVKEEEKLEKEEEKEEEKENLSEKKDGPNPKSSNVLRNSLIVGGVVGVSALGTGIGVPVYRSRRAKSLDVNRIMNANKTVNNLKAIGKYKKVLENPSNKGELLNSKRKRVNNLNVIKNRKFASNVR